MTLRGVDVGVRNKRLRGHAKHDPIHMTVPAFRTIGQGERVSMDNSQQVQPEVASGATHGKAMTMMLVIFGGSLIGGFAMLGAFFQLTR